MVNIDRDRAHALYQVERDIFISRMPISRELSKRAEANLLFGVPLHWMNDWPTPFSLYVDRANGAHLTDVDGHHYIDFCLGDTGAMFGHSPEPVVRALKEHAANGFTTMLPSKYSVYVAEDVNQRRKVSR